MVPTNYSVRLYPSTFDEPTMAVAGLEESNQVKILELASSTVVWDLKQLRLYNASQTSYIRVIVWAVRLWLVTSWVRKCRVVEWWRHMQCDSTFATWLHEYMLAVYHILRTKLKQRLIDLCEAILHEYVFPVRSPSLRSTTSHNMRRRTI